MLLEPKLLQTDKIGDVFDTMDNIGDPPVRLEDRRIERTPISLLESAAVGFRTADIVLLHRHRVGGSIAQNSAQGSVQVTHSCRSGVVRVVRKDVKQST